MIRNKNARALRRQRIKQWVHFLAAERCGQLTKKQRDNPPAPINHVVVARAGFGSLADRATAKLRRIAGAATR
jgi:hypothetical protein